MWTLPYLKMFPLPPSMSRLKCCHSPRLKVQTMPFVVLVLHNLRISVTVFVEHQDAYVCIFLLISVAASNYVISYFYFSASIDYKSGDIPTSLSILGRETQCFNISILMDSNTREDVEMIQIRLANTTSPNVIIDQANSLITITITDPCFGMYACPTEGTCYNQSQVCDSYPDCVGQGSGSAIGLLFSLDEQDCPAGEFSHLSFPLCELLPVLIIYAYLSLDLLDTE